MIALALSVALAQPTGDCSPDLLRPALGAALTAMRAKDEPAAAAALAKGAACPVTDGFSYAAHVLRADLAVHQGDWRTASALMAGVGVHPENGLSGRAGMIRLRADQGLGDADAFTTDRDALIAANDRRLSAKGGKVESFRVAGGRVDAYRAPVDQGAFHRVLEFVAVPDNKAAYPVSVLLTDDVLAAQLMAKKAVGAPAPHAWFLDLYTCAARSTLPPVASPAAATAPAYAEVRQRVTALFADGKLLAAEAPPAGSCETGLWLLPALGGTVGTPPPAP